MTTRIAQLFALVPCSITVLLAACGERRSLHEHDLLTAKCTLVERMSQWHGFLGDAEFEVGVRCDGAQPSYTQILEATDSGQYGVAISGDDRTAGSVIIFACRVGGRGGRDAVANRLADLNKATARTGLTFTMSPARTYCHEHFPRDGSMLTDWNNKNFERLLDGG